MPQIDKYELDGTSEMFSTDSVGQYALESAGRYLYAVSFDLAALRIYDKVTGASVSIAGGSE